VNKQQQYAAWTAELYETLRDDMPELAGKALAKNGQFEKVGFHAAAAHGEEGKHGGVIAAITITDAESPAKGSQVQVQGNWHWDDPVEVAHNALAASLKFQQR
jgi:hypothetical protein